MNDLVFGDNLIEDPSFEGNHWRDAWNGIGGRLVRWSNNPVRTGDRLIVIEDGDPVDFEFPDIDVELDQSYRMTIWYRTWPSNLPDLSDGESALVFYDSDTGEELAASAPLTTGSTYRRAEVVYQVPGDVQSIRPAIRASWPTGQMLFDDVSLQRGGDDAPPEPQTGFEQRYLDGAWTTFSEEADYLDALLTEIPAIREEVIGQGATGLDLRMFKLGTGPRHVFMVAQVHASELSGRDALLSLIRDWATDPGMEGYLQEVTLLIVPTARPDSQDTRVNANGVNLNRDHVQLTQGETQAIQQVITDYQPELAVDVHEGVNISNDYATSKVLNPNVHGDLHNLSHEVEQAVKVAIEDGGWTWEPYQGHNIIGPEYGHNAFGIRHSVGLLLESFRSSREGGLLETRRRYQSQRAALNMVLDWHAANLQQVASAVSASRQAAVELDEVYLPTGTQATWETITPAPDGYQVTTEDMAKLDTVRAVFALPQPDEDNRFSAEVEQRVLIHYLMDAQSGQRIVDGSRDYQNLPLRPSLPPKRPELLVKLNGVVHAARFADGSVVA